MKKERVIPLVIALLMISGFSYFSAGPTLLYTFVPGVVTALIFYFLTFYKKTPQPNKILPLYLLALAVQFLHFTEEYITGFYYKFPALFNAPAYDVDVFLVFNMLAYSLFVMGAVAIYKGVKSAMLVPLFFAVYGTIGNSIAHLIFAIMAKSYFPGLYTSLIYWILGPMLLITIWRETRASAVNS